MISRFFLMGIVGLLTLSCSPKDKKTVLLGSWKMDSVYTYDNGFGFTKRDLEEEPLHHYEQDGKLKMTREEEFRWFGYDLVQPDTLIFRDLKNKMLDKFLILRLSNEQLVLKKQKAPVFPGPGQERYEIRYFSKLKSEQ